MQVVSERPSTVISDRFKNLPLKLVETKAWSLGLMDWNQRNKSLELGFADWNQRGVEILWEWMQSERVAKTRSSLLRVEVKCRLTPGDALNESRGTTIWVFLFESENLSFNTDWPLGMVYWSRRVVFLVITSWKPSTSFGGACHGHTFRGWGSGLPRINLPIIDGVEVVRPEFRKESSKWAWHRSWCGVVEDVMSWESSGRRHSGREKRAIIFLNICITWLLSIIYLFLGSSDTW